MRYFFFLCIFAAVATKAQIALGRAGVPAGDSVIIDRGKKDSAKIFRPVITDFLVRKEYSEYAPVDTTFAREKLYRLGNYTHTDPFYQSPFANAGGGFQSLRPLSPHHADVRLLPDNKRWLYLPADSVDYYDVKVPTTSFTFNNGMRNGATLLSTYTQNFGKNLNIALSYYGMRSQGFYRNDLASNNYFLVSANYRNKKGNYKAFAHYYNYINDHQENGGIVSLDNYYYDDRFKNRLNLETRLSGADSRYRNRRYYFSQYFTPFSKGIFSGGLQHIFQYTTSSFYFNESAANADLAHNEQLQAYPFSVKKYNRMLRNDILARFGFSTVTLSAGVRLENSVTGAGLPQIYGETAVPDKVSEFRIGFTGRGSALILKKIQLDTDLSATQGGVFGTELRSFLKIVAPVYKELKLEGSALFYTGKPAVNWLLNASPYPALIYENLNAINETWTQLDARIHLPWFGISAGTTYTGVNGLAYWDSRGSTAQAEVPVRISQIYAEGLFSYRKFHLDTKVSFQQSLSGKDYLPLPQLIARANVYYESDLFNKAMRLRAGIKAWYYSEYRSRVYIPQLNEFGLAGGTAYAIGNYPVLDVYANAKVKTMVFLIEAQNVGASFMRNRLFAAPYFPGYDFRLNIGLQWRLFH